MSKPSLEHIVELIEQLEDAISGIPGENLAYLAIENARETIYDLFDEDATEEGLEP